MIEIPNPKNKTVSNASLHGLMKAPSIIALKITIGLLFITTVQISKLNINDNKTAPTLIKIPFHLG